MPSDADRLRKAVDQIYQGAPWRHPALLSAVVWLYTGSGSRLVWVGGDLVVPADQREDLAYLAGDDPMLRHPLRPSPAKEVVGLVDRLLPSPKMLLAALHSGDFAPPADMPALRAPQDAMVAHLAGIIVACRVLLACAPLVVDPAAAPPQATRVRLARGLYVAATATVVRGVTKEVVAAATVLLEGAADRGNRQRRRVFVDPILQEDG